MVSLFNEEFCELLRNNNAVELLEQFVGRAKRAREIQRQISSMDTFWSVPLRHIVDGKETEAPVKLSPEGHPLGYESIKPIRLVFEVGHQYKSPFDEAKMKGVFDRYCELTWKNGNQVPIRSFSGKLRFHVKRLVKRIAEAI